MEQIGVALPFTCFYSSLGLGTTGLTVTVDIYRNGTIIVTAASATEAGGGLYTYLLAAGSNTVEGVYVAIFKTATTTVDQQHLVMAWMVGQGGVEYLDAAITSRLAPTTAGRTLDVSATGEAGVDWGNVGSPTTTVGLTNTTVGTATNLTNNQAKYMGGAVWVNTVSGVAGTTSYTNGIMTNPCSTLPNAKTIADNIFLKKFWIQAGSSIALSADMIGYVLEGSSWTLSSVSARNISGTLIRNCENLTGLYTSPTQECYVYDCQVGTSRWGEVDMHGCHIVGTITMNAAVPYLFDRCMGIPANSPTLNFGSVADARSAVIKDYGNSLTVTNMRAGNVLNIDGDCELILDATCTGGTVYINGNINLTNNGTGLTIHDTSRYGEDQSVASVTDRTGFALTAAYDAAKTAAQASDIPSTAQIDTQLSGTHGSGAWGPGTLGAGAISTTVTVTVSGLARDGIEVWLTTDSAGVNVVASGTTDAMSHVTFMLDAGTYYVWKQLSGVNFTNPETLVVS